MRFIGLLPDGLMLLQKLANVFLELARFLQGAGCRFEGEVFLAAEGLTAFV
jgi:hypothetical protein